MKVLSAKGSPEDAAAFGKTFGELRMQGGALGKLSDDDLAEITQKVQQTTGGLSEAELRAVSRSSNQARAQTVDLSTLREGVQTVRRMLRKARSALQGEGDGRRCEPVRAGNATGRRNAQVISNHSRRARLRPWQMDHNTAGTRDTTMEKSNAKRQDQTGTQTIPAPLSSAEAIAKLREMASLVAFLEARGWNSSTFDEARCELSDALDNAMAAEAAAGTEARTVATAADDRQRQIDLHWFLFDTWGRIRRASAIPADLREKCERAFSEDLPAYPDTMPIEALEAIASRFSELPPAILERAFNGWPWRIPSRLEAIEIAGDKNGLLDVASLSTSGARVFACRQAMVTDNTCLTVQIPAGMEHKEALAAMVKILDKMQQDWPGVQDAPLNTRDARQTYIWPASDRPTASNPTPL